MTVAGESRSARLSSQLATCCTCQEECRTQRSPEIAAPSTLTIGIQPLLMESVLSALVRSVVREHIHWRRAVRPVGAGGARQVPSLQELVSRLSEDLSALGPLDPLLETLEEQLLKSDEVVGIGPGGYLNSLERVDALHLDSELECRPGHASVLTRNGDEVVVTFIGGSMVAPAFCEPALRYILERSRFRVGGLPQSLTGEAKVTRAADSSVRACCASSTERRHTRSPAPGRRRGGSSAARSPLAPPAPFPLGLERVEWRAHHAGDTPHHGLHEVLRGRQPWLRLEHPIVRQRGEAMPRGPCGHSQRHDFLGWSARVRLAHDLHHQSKQRPAVSWKEA